MNFKRRCEIARGKLDIAPLIDVVLLLLIFFMLSSSMIMPTALKVNLPRSQAASAQAGRTVRIMVDRDGGLYWQGRAVTKDGLAERMERLAGSEPETLVVLDADRDASHGAVVEVMSMAYAHGLRRFAIAAVKEKGK